MYWLVVADLAMGVAIIRPKAMLVHACSGMRIVLLHVSTSSRNGGVEDGNADQGRFRPNRDSKPGSLGRVFISGSRPHVIGKYRSIKLIAIPGGTVLCVIAAIALTWLVCSIIAAFKAWDGKPYRYPLTMRLLG
jgi:hypothetical protein